MLRSYSHAEQHWLHSTPSVSRNEKSWLLGWIVIAVGIRLALAAISLGTNDALIWQHLATRIGVDTGLNSVPFALSAVG